MGWGALPIQAYGGGFQCGEVLASIRTLLNDDEGIIWPDQKLFPKLRTAYRMMVIALIQNGVPIIANISTVILVPAGTTDLSQLPAYPTNPDIMVPIWMKERAPGQTEQDFVDMTEVDYLPDLNPSTELIWWCWINQVIKFIGSTQDREVKLRYRGNLPYLMESTTEIGLFGGESYLSFKTAALALSSITPLDVDRVNYFNTQAEKNLEDLLITASLESQNLPAKRRPYHRGRGRSRVLRDF